MGYERDDAFEVENGVVLNDTSHLTSGVQPPTVAYPSPPAFAVYFQSNGVFWAWNGVSWIQVGLNFSYRRVASGIVLTIPEEQQMIISQEIFIEDTAELEIFGELVGIA